MIAVDTNVIVHPLTRDDETQFEAAYALRRLFGLDNVGLEHPLQVATALDWQAQGLDFADAFRLAAAQEADRFVTFDHALVRRAAALSAIIVASP